MMKTKLFSFALVCALTLAFTACKDLDADAKAAAAAQCEWTKLGKKLVKSSTDKKAIAAQWKKYDTIRKRYMNKTTKKMDSKFEEAYFKYRAECQ